MLVIIVVLILAFCACTGRQMPDANSLDNWSDKDNGSVDTEAEGKLKNPKSCIGKWYAEFNYTGENNGEPEVFLYANVREDGTYDLRWVEPADPEDFTETFEYELVDSPAELTEIFIHLYYDEENDQLVLNADGEVIALDREE